MKLSDFHFDLPEELIAHYPPARRRDSRLLHLDRQQAALQHRRFDEFPSLIQPNDLLVFNNTRVIAARLFGRKESGGKVEVLLERVLPGQRALAQIKASRSPSEGSRVILGEGEDALEVDVLGREEGFFLLQFPEGEAVMDTIDRIGHMPLPPYIRREDELTDRERYQTVYGSRKGAVAAPTAGLHFDEVILQAIRERGADLGFVTLHVGAGTFQPVRCDEIEAHRIHREYAEVSEALCEQVARCREKQGRVIAIGTTSVRCLETASQSGQLQPFAGDTDIYIYPGYRFRTVDALLTNFHLPESTLIMLISAFAGHERTMSAYREAVVQRYRFFSYGDAMFIS